MDTDTEPLYFGRKTPPSLTVRIWSPVWPTLSSLGGADAEIT